MHVHMIVHYGTVHRKHDGDSICRLTLFAAITESMNIFGGRLWRPYIVFTFRYSYGFVFVMDYICQFVCMYISGNSRWRRSRSTLCMAHNHLCSHFAVYLSIKIRTLVCVCMVMLVRSLLKDSPVRYSSKYEDRATGIFKMVAL